jgi:guanylate kinase
MGTALDELRAVEEFEYIVVNDDLETAMKGLEAIVMAERQKRTRYVALEGRVAKMEQVLGAIQGGVGR